MATLPNAQLIDILLMSFGSITTGVNTKKDDVREDTHQTCRVCSGNYRTTFTMQDHNSNNWNIVGNVELALEHAAKFVVC